MSFVLNAALVGAAIFTMIKSRDPLVIFGLLAVLFVLYGLPVTS